MAEQEAPVPAKTTQQTSPVQRGSAGPQQMVNVCPIVALAFHDKALGPNHLLERNQPYFPVQNEFPNAVLEPVLIDLNKSISRAENEIDKGLPPIHLRQPMRKCQFRGPSLTGECRQGTLAI